MGLIRHALARCGRVLALSYTRPEYARCDVATRQRWLDALSARHPRLQALAFGDALARQWAQAASTPPRPLPPNDAADAVHQHHLAWLLRDVLHAPVDALFASEPWLPACAAVLSAQLGRPVAAVPGDAARKAVPVAASAIRAAPRAHRRWMDAAVRASLTPRVAVLGAESSGKSTLARALAQALGGVCVDEYGRSHWQARSGVLTPDDLHHIAQRQVRLEDAAAARMPPVVVGDTSPLTTLGYAQWLFELDGPLLAALAARPYDALVLCEPDFGFVQDGTRQGLAFSARQHAWYRARLSQRPEPVWLARGSLEQRLAELSPRIVALMNQPLHAL